MADPGSAAPCPDRRASDRVSDAYLTAGSIVLAIGALYFGRDIFIPFALAILLSFALAPVVHSLRANRSCPGSSRPWSP